MTKVELYELIKLYSSQYRTYKINDPIAHYGHTVRRLSPYHPDLNLFEKVWGIVKNRVAAKNDTFKIDDVSDYHKKLSII
jgi:transposase